MDKHPPRVALLVCPACGQQHTVRVDAPRTRVACGAWAAAAHDNGGVEARVWRQGEQHLGGRLAFLIDV